MTQIYHHYNYRCVSIQNLSHIAGFMIACSHDVTRDFLAKLSICPAKPNLQYIINENFIEFAKDSECPDNFQSLS